MSPHSVPPLVFAGLAFYIAIFHLLIFFHRRSGKAHLAFALMSVAACLYNIFSVGLYNSSNVAQGAEWQRLQLAAIALFCLFLFWFVVEYLEHPARRLIPFVAFFFGSVAVLLLVLRGDLSLRLGVPEIKQITLPWGYRITYYEAQQGPIARMLVLIPPLEFFAVLWLALREIHSGHRREAGALLGGIAFMAAGVFNDIAVSTGLYSFLYLLEFSFLGLIVFMANRITRSVVETAEVRETLVQRELERERLLESLKETSTLLEAIFDGIPDIIGVQDREHRIIRYNEAGYHLLGLSPQDVQGKHCYELIGQTEPCVPCATSQTYVTRQPARIEKHVPELDRWFDVRSYPILDAEGEIVRVIEHLRDITAEKQTEELQQRLQQAQKLEAVGRLAGNIAHDFNNLLTVIRGDSEVALHLLEEGTPRAEELEEIRETVDRATALIRQVLAFSRHQIFSLQPLDLNRVLQGMDNMLHRLTGEEIELVVLGEPELWPVNADRSQLEQIILNLILNARDALAQGGTIRIQTENTTLPDYDPSGEIAAGDHVQLTVSDNGSGMSEEIRARVFEPFFSTKPEEKGTGLGLSTVYGIVKQHGGFITVDSTLGQGSRFHVFLPRAEAKLEESALPGEPPDLKGSEAVLLVEDDAAVRGILVKALGMHGYVVHSFASPLKALGSTREGGVRPEILVTDVVMPGLDGKKLAEQLRRSFPELPVLFISGYSDQTVLGPGGPAKAEYLQKPFKPADLLRKVRGLLDRS